MILISTQCFPPDTGGIESLLYSLASALSAAGEEVRVYADYHSGADTLFDQQQAFPIYRFSGIKPWRRRKKARAIMRCSIEQADNPAVLITDSWKSLELVETRHLSAVLCLAHGTEIPPQVSATKSRRIRGAYSRASHIVANSHYTAGVVKPYVSRPEKIRIIHPGIPAPSEDLSGEALIQARLAVHDPVLITVARLEERKGHMSVISILPRLLAEFPRLLYVIAGNGDCLAILKTAVADTGMQSHVLFAGTVQDPEKTAWLRSSTLFIMPGRQIGQDVEGFGLAYLEAALQGLPAIACNSGGAPEAVLHRQTGLVCRPDDLEDLAQATLELLRNRPYLSQLGASAQARASTFLWKTKYTEYLRLLRS
jgi:phosphatidyl-myo-inositol dimannoside synthase